MNSPRTVALLASSLLLVACQGAPSAATEAVAAPAVAAISTASPGSSVASLPAGSAAPEAAASPIEPIASAVKKAPAKLSIKRLVVAEGVHSREPMEPSASFSMRDVNKIYAFVELDNPSGSPSNIVIDFVRRSDSTKSGNVALDVGAARRWRTWAFTRNVSRGEWEAVVRGPGGEELGRAPFEVTL